MSKDTHKLMLGHSQAKVKLYGNYLAKYLNIISRDGFTETIHIYDLFCGEGIYEDGGQGSPMIALEKILNCYQGAPQMPKVNITFNDKGTDVISKLNENLKKVSISQNCKTRVFNDDYLNLVDKVNTEINAFGNEKAVVFLDPKGYKEISIADIKKLLSTDKSEVLVFLPIRDMHRFANMDESKMSTSAGHEPLYKFMREVFPDQIPSFDSQLDFITKVKEGLKKVIPNIFVDTFLLEKEPGQFFCMFFFTTHIYGFEKMLETKWELDTEQGRAFRYEQSGTMFSGSEVLNFPDKLKEFIQSDKKYNGDVYYFSLHEGFLPKHANDVLRDWQGGSTLNVMNQNGTPARKNSFYLNYQTYKSDPKKIYFDIKLTLF